MSNYPPPDSPLSTQPLQPGMQTQGPPGAPPPQMMPPKQKSKALFWVLGGCGAMLVVGAIVVIGVVWWGVNKAKEAGIDPDLWEKHPAVAAAKLMAATNPDVEIVSVDEENETITFKDKKTGEVLTITLNEAREGKVSVSSKDKNASIEFKGEGDKGSIEFKSDEGEVKFGSGAAAVTLPDWLPSYPGVTLQGTYSMQTKEGQNGAFSFTTRDPVDRIISFYEDGLKSRGFTVNTSLMRQDGKVSGGTLSAETADSKRTCFVSVTGVEDGNQATVSFGTQN